MRKIKFRFWNGDKLVNPKDLALIDGEIYLINEAEKDEYPTINTELNVSHVTAEQYTGMFDDNGVGIYEGDIVKIITHDEDRLGGLGEEYICTVHFGGGDWWGSFTIKNDEFHKGFALLANRRNDRVVIGNIHEHKHLLDNKYD